MYTKFTYLLTASSVTSLSNDVNLPPTPATPPNTPNIAGEGGPPSSTEAPTLSNLTTAETEGVQGIPMLNRWLMESDHDETACAVVRCWKRH